MPFTHNWFEPIWKYINKTNYKELMSSIHNGNIINLKVDSNHIRVKLDYTLENRGKYILSRLDSRLWPMTI